MNYVKCKKGHMYDPSLTPTCPQCAAESGSSFENYGPTEPVTAGSSSPNVDFGVFSVGATEPVPPTMPETTEIPPSFHSGYSTNDGYSTNSGYSATGGGYTRSHVPAASETSYPTNNGFDVMPPTEPLYPKIRPVVGWLVCVEGPDKGRDYPIRDGYNTIGRDPSNDIAVQNDFHISREKHALVAYDRRERVFFYGPCEGRNIVRLNGKMLMQASEIHAYDMIDFESTKLMFVPFCGERFNWDE